MTKVEITKIKPKRKDSDEVKQIKKETVFPAQKNKLLAIILRENKSSHWKWIDYDREFFRVGKHTYFKEPRGTYLSENKVLVAVYIEGICIPVSHKYIKKQKVKRPYVDPNGKEIEIEVTVIEGMKFDSEIADMLLNRHLADEFLKNPADSGMIIIVVLLILSVIFGVLNLAGHFFL